MTALASRAVMQRRHEAPDSLDFFPTPPWATRAFIAHVLKPKLGAHRNDVILEPACGEGHMAVPLAEQFTTVHASDVFAYGYGEQRDFLDEAAELPAIDWIVTNPPFNLALDFARRATNICQQGVCLLVRIQWLATLERHEFFMMRKPYLVAVCAERVPMHRGEWKPDGSTTTDYAWICWRRFDQVTDPRLVWVPPGCRERFTLPFDARRFAKPAAAPLLDGAQ